MSLDEILTTVLAEVTSVLGTHVNPDDNLVADAGADSLDCTLLAASLEDRFYKKLVNADGKPAHQDIVIPDSPPHTEWTARVLAQLVFDQLQGKEVTRESAA